MIISADKIKLLEKFGFRMTERDSFLHKKLNVELSNEHVEALPIDNLENHMREALRTS